MNIWSGSIDFVASSFSYSSRERPSSRTMWSDPFLFRTTQRPALFFTVLFLIAFFIKLIVLFKFSNSIFADYLILDMQDYNEWALRISQGQLIGDAAFDGMPFYPYFLGFVYSLAGPSLFAIRFLQIILGSLSCVLVFIIARRLFNATAGIIAFSFMLLFKEFYMYEMMLLPTTFGIFLFLAIIMLLFSFV